MDVEIIEARGDLKRVVQNLCLYYCYDFTEMLSFRCPDNGLYGTDCWDKYWNEAGRWAFLVRSGGEPAGFVMVGKDGTQPDTQFDMGEFFVMRKLRRQGVGQRVAFDVFERFRGRWEVRVVVENTPALEFWRKVVGRYTGGKYVELPEPVWNGQFWDVVMTFDNTVRK